MDKQNQQLIQLPPNDLWPFEHISTRHDAKIQQGVNPDALLVPGFWAHHAMKLKPFDEIRARAEDGTWMGNYLVLDCSRTWAKVKLLELYHLGTADVSLTQASEAEVKAYMDQHEVKHRGPRGWSVVRKADRLVLQEHMAQREEAEGWLTNHARAQVGAPSTARVETAPAPA